MIAARCGGCGTIGCDGNNLLCIQNNINTNPYSIEQQVKDYLQDFKRQLSNLERYKSTPNGDMVESSLFDEYIKLEDILALFSPKIKLK